MSNNFTTRTASLRATTADIRKLEAKDIILGGKNIQENFLNYDDGRQFYYLYLGAIGELFELLKNGKDLGAGFWPKAKIKDENGNYIIQDINLNPECKNIHLLEIIDEQQDLPEDLSDLRFVLSATLLLYVVSLSMMEQPAAKKLITSKSIELDLLYPDLTNEALKAVIVDVDFSNIRRWMDPIFGFETPSEAYTSLIYITKGDTLENISFDKLKIAGGGMISIVNGTNPLSLSECNNILNNFKFNSLELIDDLFQIEGVYSSQGPIIFNTKLPELKFCAEIIKFISSNENEIHFLSNLPKCLYLAPLTSNNYNLTKFRGTLPSLICGIDAFGNAKLDSDSLLCILDSINNLSLILDEEINAKLLEIITLNLEAFGGNDLYLDFTPEILEEILTSYVGKLTIGMGYDDSDETRAQIANEIGYNSWQEIEDEFIAKGWDVEWEFNGPISSTYSLRNREETSQNVYVKLKEVTNNPLEKIKANYKSEDGTKLYNLIVKKNTSKPELYEIFESEEAAVEHYKLIKIEHKKENSKLIENLKKKLIKYKF